MRRQIVVGKFEVRSGCHERIQVSGFERDVDQVISPWLSDSVVPARLAIGQSRRHATSNLRVAKDNSRPAHRRPWRVGDADRQPGGQADGGEFDGLAVACHPEAEGRHVIFRNLKPTFAADDLTGQPRQSAQRQPEYPSKPSTRRIGITAASTAWRHLRRSALRLSGLRGLLPGYGSQDPSTTAAHCPGCHRRRYRHHEEPSPHRSPPTPTR